LLLDVIVWEEEESVKLADSVEVSLDVELEESEGSEVDVEGSRESLEVSSEGVL
jgi:hypothetical protein